MKDRTSPSEESGDRAGMTTGQPGGPNGPAAADATGARQRNAAAARRPATAGRPPIANADAPTAKIRLPKSANGSAADQSGAGDRRRPRSAERTPPRCDEWLRTADSAHRRRSAPAPTGRPDAGPARADGTDAAARGRRFVERGDRPQDRRRAGGRPTAASARGRVAAERSARRHRPPSREPRRKPPNPWPPASGRRRLRRPARSPPRGPAAASPPPWNRVPGRSSTAERSGRPGSRPGRPVGCWTTAPPRT